MRQNSSLHSTQLTMMAAKNKPATSFSISDILGNEQRSQNETRTPSPPSGMPYKTIKEDIYKEGYMVLSSTADRKRHSNYYERASPSLFEATSPTAPPMYGNWFPWLAGSLQYRHQTSYPGVYLILICIQSKRNIMIHRVFPESRKHYGRTGH